MYLFITSIIYRVSQKNVILWKNGHNYLQTHPKCKSWGCFGKFRIFATKWALRFSKLNKKWLRKWSLKLPTPPPKIGIIHCSHYALLWWSSAFSWLAMKAKLVPYAGKRWNKSSFVTFAWCVKFKDPYTLENGWEDQWVWIVSREFWPFLEGGLVTLCFIFSVISSSNLKISVPIW